MDNSNNMGFHADHTTCAYQHWHPHNCNFLGNVASSSYLTSFDLGRTPSTLPLSLNYPFLSEKSGHDDLEPLDSYSRTAYPSPPSTSSNSKRSVPLPCLHAEDFSRDRFPSSKIFGGILDSPVVMRHDSLGCHAPISPPPTLPTQTQALPPLESPLLPSIQELDDSESSLFLDTRLPRTDRAHDEPLSPLSPEWAPDGIPPEIYECPERSFLLHQTGSNLLNYATDEPRSPVSPPAPFSLEFYDRCPRSAWGPCPLDSVESEPKSRISSTSPLSPPASPVLPMLGVDDLETHPYPELPEPEDDQLPSSPSPPRLSLPDFEDDDMQIVEEEDANTLHFDTPDHTDHSLSPPPSPGQFLLALPVTDPNDHLYFTEPPENKPALFSSLHPDTSSRSLLLLDDPNDVPPPRSPSPETFPLDPSQLALEGRTDSEYRRLWDSWKRSQAAERTARIQETQALELGRSGVSARWEARQTKMLEKERGREIAAMLRLKLAEKGVKVDSGGSVLDDDAALVSIDDGDGLHRDRDAMQVDRDETEPRRTYQSKTKKNEIGSMEQLVARMLLRRNDASRALANRKSPVQSHSKSPLARRVVAVDDAGGGDMDMDDEDDWGLELRSWPIQ